MIFFENVTKEFPNGTVALTEVTFRFEPGEFGFLVGPSGAGKTTILRLLLKDLSPTSGKISVQGQDISELKNKYLPEHRRQIGSAFQDFKLIEDRTVLENVSIISEMVHSSKEESEQEVEKILELVGLKDKKDLFPSQLSGGELQRTAIARALATKPKILFADEPTGNLDQATAWEIINLLLDINKSGTTVLVATHNLEIIKSLDKRIIELNQGRVVKDTKKPKEEKQEPDTKEEEVEERKEKESEEPKVDEEKRKESEKTLKDAKVKKKPVKEKKEPTKEDQPGEEAKS